ncbi:GntR family transcriptional regulator [Speluncibacter jeojiensis]|uniref:GntR family transcriptional regulator n=1 Tax=Speluncibacter jeojiensis TaxID=2710754 RepID=A0A9X4RFS7_9ACTN|nr:GntR family transcriptional regulator [Corynebacteriales bacterium D3-21]
MTEATRAAGTEQTGQSKSEFAYQQIRAKIVDGQWSAGHRLVLSRVAAELGVSVVPVREAVRRLEAESLVTFERNVGATVARLDLDEYRWTMETLAIVESAATGYSAPLLDRAARARARAINDEMRACLARFDPEEFTALNARFHQELCAQCPNPHLLDLVGRGWARLTVLRSSTFVFVPGRAEESVAEHDRILDLIEAEAPRAEIESAARAHRENTLHLVLANQPSATKPPGAQRPKGRSQR